MCIVFLALTCSNQIIKDDIEAIMIILYYVVFSLYKRACIYRWDGGGMKVSFAVHAYIFNFTVRG